MKYTDRQFVFKFEPMYLSADQGCSPSGAMHTEGAVSDCVNLRFNHNTMEAVGNPRRLLYTEGKPLLADMMNGHHYLFTQGDDGTLYYQRLTDDEVFLPLIPRELGRVAQDVKSAVSVGEFIIMLLADSTLVYARRDVANDAYLWLGALPSLPPFSIRAVEGSAVTASMKGIKFATPLTDISGAVPEQVASSVAQAWHDAHTRLIETLHTAGQWTAPVDVRLALRLWDGSLLQVSSPVRLSPPRTAGSGRLNIGLLWNETKKQFTGTDGATLSGTGYTIAVQPEEPLPVVWSGLVSGLEVWVSREPRLVEVATAPRLAYISNTSGNYLSLTPVMRSASAVLTDVAKAPAGRHSLLEEDATLSVLQYSSDVVYDSALTPYLTSMPGSGNRKVNCILAHDGFFHLGSGESLYTSRAGNPLVVASHSDGLGAPVCALMAQTTGGGAYTRQYIYAATERGIVAVTHRADGVHTNARSVCREPLGNTPVWCATPYGVYALSCTGSLLCLRDAKAPTLLSRLQDVRSILWSHAHGELWLCASEASLVLSPAMNYAAYRRTCSLMSLPTPCAPSLVWDEDNLGGVRIFSLERELPQGEPGVYSVRVSLPLSPDTSASAVDLFMTGQNINWSVTDCIGRVLGRLIDAPLQHGMLRMPLPRVLPRPGTYRLRRELDIKIEGDIERLNSFIVHSYKS